MHKYIIHHHQEAGSNSSTSVCWHRITHACPNALLCACVCMRDCSRMRHNTAASNDIHFPCSTRPRSSLNECHRKQKKTFSFWGNPSKTSKNQFSAQLKTYMYIIQMRMKALSFVPRPTSNFIQHNRLLLVLAVARRHHAMTMQFLARSFRRTHSRSQTYNIHINMYDAYVHEK